MGLTYNGTSIQTANIHLELAQGFGTASVRGRDSIAPGTPGRFARNRVASVRSIPLHGWVQGTGSTLLARQQSWLTAREALDALMDPTLAARNLVASAPEMGLAAAATRTISARVVNELSGPIQGGTTFQRVTFDLEAVGNPPDWTAA